MASFDQRSFAGGQVSSRYFGTANTQNENRLALARNCLIDAEGSLQKRPGSQVLLHSSDGRYSGSVPSEKRGKPWKLAKGKKARLIPFRYSNNDQYTLVLRDMKMDVLKNGEVVAVDIDTPWPETDLHFDPENDETTGIKFSQSGRLMVVTHPNHLPRQWNRISDTEWELGFVNQLRRGTTASNLSVGATGGTSATNTQHADYQFRFMAIGADENDGWLSEVTAEERDIASIEFRNGLASLRVSADLEIAVGDRVLLSNLDSTTGAQELNGNSYRITGFQASSRGSTKQCRYSPWITGSSTSAARAAARASIVASGYTEDITFETTEISGTNPGTPRFETDNFTAQFQVTNRQEANLPTSVSASLLTEVLRLSGKIKSGDRVVQPSSSHDISSVGAGLVHGGSSDQWSKGAVIDGFIRLETFNSGGSPYAYKRFTVSGRVQRIVGQNAGTTSTSGYRVRARGCRTGPEITENASIFDIDTELSSMTPYVTSSGGKIFTFIRSVTAKRDASIGLGWSGVSPDVARIAIFQDVGRGFGRAADTLGPETKKTIQNVLEDVSIAPPLFRNPFKDSNPQCSAVFQERRGFGGFTPDRPHTLKFSRHRNFIQFDQSVRILGNDAFDVDLDAEEINDIRHMVRLKETLFVFTGGGMWRLSAGSQGFSEFSRLISKEQSYGASHLRPLTIGDTVLHVAETGDIIYATGLNASTDRHITGLLSKGFHDILARKTVVDWDYAEGRTIIILAAMDDGTMVASTYDPVNSHIATSEWILGGGFKCRGVSVKNTDGIDPIGILLVEDKEGVQHLWKMEFSRDSLSARFLADGVTSHDAADETDKADKEWINYKISGGEIYRNLKKDEHFDNGRRVPFHRGHEFETLIRTVPNWDAYPHHINKVQARLKIGSNVYIKGQPEGDLRYFNERFKSNQLNLQGGVEAIVKHGSLMNAFGPQVEIGQDHPSPFVILGITCYASGTDQ